MYGRILIPVDGSPASDRAVAEAVELARCLESSVLFLFAMDTAAIAREGVTNFDEALTALRDQGEQIVTRARATAESAGVHAETLLTEGPAAEVILLESDKHDLVVMSSHGKTFMERVLYGSVTEAVLHHIARPLLILQCRPTEAKVPP